MNKHCNEGTNNGASGNQVGCFKETKTWVICKCWCAGAGVLVLGCRWCKCASASADLCWLRNPEVCAPTAQSGNIRLLVGHRKGANDH